MQSMFAVHDDLVGYFLTPFPCQNENAAVRQFGDVVRQGGTPLSQHPGDYSLWYLGEFDEVTGVASMDGKSARRLVMASDFSSAVPPRQSETPVEDPGNSAETAEK